MRSQKKIWVLLGPAIIGLVLLQGCQLTEFPGLITTPPFTYETDPDGIRSYFHDGEVYRYPGIIPMLSVRGDHYEMGLQHGVLLRPEILAALNNYARLLRWFAEEEGIPYPLFTAVCKLKSTQIALKLPARFRDEIRGLADGSGVPYTSVLAISMFYDVLTSVGCTGILLRGDDGTVIHGRNQDWFALEELGDLSVVVRYNAPGYHTVTHIDWLLGLGVDTGYNDAGLAFSEDTISVKKTNGKGFSIVYLSRIALEECSNLEELKHVFDRYPIIGGTGTVWSDRDEGKGMVIEASPTGWKALPMVGSILWNFNHYYDESLKREHQPARKYLSGCDWDREYIASGFLHRGTYAVEDAVDFLRGQIAPDGNDYAWYGTVNPVCNDSGWQMIIFDPHSDGFYFGWGKSFAAKRDIYRFYEDFSIRPELYQKALYIPPMVEDMARIANALFSEDELLAAYVDLAARYSDEANARFRVGYTSFVQKRMKGYKQYALDAFAMNPFVPEYGLYAGLARYGQKQPDAAISTLEGLDTTLFTPLQSVYRAMVLERSYAATNPLKSLLYRLQYQFIISRYNAQAYFEQSILPRIDALENW